MNSTQNHTNRNQHVQDIKRDSNAQRQNMRPVRRVSNMPDKQNGPQKIVRYKGPIDRTFLMLVLILIGFGTVMVFSASYAYSMSRYSGNGYVYITKQLTNVAIGLIFMFITARLLEPRFLRRQVGPLYIFTVILLLLVLAIGTFGGGAKRWIMIAGFSVQPSEIAKATLVFLLAYHFDQHSQKIISPENSKQSVIYGFAFPLAYTGFICLLVALEKHLSGTIIIFLIGITMMWAGGTNAKFIVIPGAVGGTLFTALALLIPYTRRRIDIWLNPTKDITGSGWQTIQSLNAIGSGGLLGLGPTNSRQKHMYVSQPQNDFIYSILCEELGFVGAITVIILFVALIVRGYQIAKRCPDTFSSLVVIGIVTKIGIQAAFNIGVVTNLIPNTGISLPFFSYGGSSTIVLLTEMGVVLSLSRFSRQDR